MAAVRVRLLPIEVENVDREIIVDKVVTAIIAEENNEIEDCFANLEKETLTYVGNNLKRQSLMFPQILHRGRQRREVINKSLGGNTAHRHQYKEMKNNRRYEPLYSAKVSTNEETTDENNDIEDDTINKDNMNE